jgi:hypothetical protein
MSIWLEAPRRTGREKAGRKRVGELRRFGRQHVPNGVGALAAQMAGGITGLVTHFSSGLNYTLPGFLETSGYPSRARETVVMES